MCEPCPRCGSTNITIRIEENAFGDRYLVEHCQDCSHEDEWLLGDGDDE